MIPGRCESIELKYHLEDHRSNSGHLQRLLPAPCDGFYLPLVSFGQRVFENEIIGYVHDDLGQNRTPVCADRDGIVFILRSVPSVREGDPLGAILPVVEENKMQSIYE
jgi:predicted deacylase